MIDHFIKDNKIVFRARLKLRRTKSENPIEVNLRSVEQYIEDNDISVGKPIDVTQFAGNWDPALLEAFWTYKIPKSTKKSLTKNKNNVSITNKTKQRQKPSRARAKQLAAAKRAIKEKLDDTTTKPKTRARRKKPTTKD
tara:strand:+ start:36 stop:452 length:417 start_codon:yes stop_codon:yes gene_type:complete